MSLFHSILEKLSKSLQVNELNKEEITKDISSIVGVNIKPDQIKIIDGKLLFFVSPTIKTVILLKKTLILKSLIKYKINTIG